MTGPDIFTIAAVAILIPESISGSIIVLTDAESHTGTGQRANGSDSGLSRDQGPALKCADILHGKIDREQSVGQGTASTAETGCPDREQQRNGRDRGSVSSSGMARHRGERARTGRESVGLHAGKLPLAGSEAEILNEGQASAEVKAAGAVSRDIRAATEAVRVAGHQAAHTSVAVRAAARQAVSARVERRAADGNAAARAGGVRVVARQAEEAGVEGPAGSSSKELS